MNYKISFYIFAIFGSVNFLWTVDAKKQQHRDRTGKKKVQKQEKFISYGLPDALGENLTTENYLTYILLKNCKDEKPWCTGKDCNLVPDNRGCLICACPMGSKARGCDKMPIDLYTDLTINGCPMVVNRKMMRTPAQRVTRFYRFIDPDQKIDECRSYAEPLYPFCQFLDANLWNGPETEAECKELCFARNPIGDVSSGAVATASPTATKGNSSHVVFLE